MKGLLNLIRRKVFRQVKDIGNGHFLLVDQNFELVNAVLDCVYPPLFPSSIENFSNLAPNFVVNRTKTPTERR
jgi:hypothetical protein